MNSNLEERESTSRQFRHAQREARVNSPLLRPLDGRIVHLVDDDDQLGDTSSLDESRMLSSLTSLVETSLELSLSSRDDL